MRCVFTIKIRLIIGSLIAYAVAVAAHMVSVPPVAIELNTDVVVKTASAYESTAVQQVTQAVSSVKTSGSNTEEKVRNYFADIPVMIAVARCESGFRQFDPNNSGAVHRGIVNPRDLGVMQINEHYHGATAAKLDLNLYTLEGNLAYARYLYKTQGTQPWSASRPCWGSASLAIK